MTASTRPESAPRARPDLELGHVTGWTFVFDRTARRLHRLNSTAAAVLVQLDGTVAIDDLIVGLARDFDTPVDQVGQGVHTILTEFRQEGLLLGSGSQDPAPEPAIKGRLASTSRLAPAMTRRLEDRRGSIDLGRHQALDLAFRVTTDDDESVEGLRAILAPLAVAAAEPLDDDGSGPFGRSPVRTYHLRRPATGGTQWRLHLDATRIHLAFSRPSLVDHLLWHLNRMAVLTCPRDTVFHAAAATWAGGAVLLPGESNAGKSTLVTGLVAPGFDYLSDEAVLLDDRDRLWPFPKAIDLDPGSWPVLPHLAPATSEAELHQARWHVPSDRVRAGSRGMRAPLRAILAPRYEADAAPRLDPLGPEEAVEILLEQAFHLGARPGALAQVVRLVESVPCHRVVSGDLDGAVALVRSVVGE